MNPSISLMGKAGEGRACEMALLAGYLVNNNGNLNLVDYLEEMVFAGNIGTSISPILDDISGFNTYIEEYKACLPVNKVRLNININRRVIDSCKIVL